MRYARLAAPAVALVVALPVGVGSAASTAADGALRFLDDRPIVIDLDRYEHSARFAVTIVVDGGAAGSVVRTDVVGDIAATLDAPDLPLPVTAAEPGRLTLTVQRRTTGNGLLVVTTGENKVITRPVRTVRSSVLTPMPDELELRGTRLSPFGDRVRVEPLVLGFDPMAEIGRCSSSVVEVGHLVGSRSRRAVILRDGCTLRVEGLTSSGAFAGRAALRPGEEDDDVAISVLVRDAWGWPLLTLVLGLWMVSWLDVFKRRHRPRRVLLNRLARLRRRAAETAALHGVEVDAGPLITATCEHALDEFDAASADGDRQRWELGGEGYQAIEALVDQYVNLVERLRGVQNHRQRFIGLARPVDQPRIRDALDASIVGRSHRPRPLTTRAELHQAHRDASAAAAHLVAIESVYDMLRPILGHEGAIADRAAGLLSTLLGRGVDPDELRSETRMLARRWHESQRPTVQPARPGAAVPPGAVVPPGAADALASAGEMAAALPPAAPVPAGSPPVFAARRGTRLLPFAMAAACLAIVVAAFPLAVQRGAPGNGAAIDDPTTTTVPLLPLIPGEAPVAIAPLARSAPLAAAPGTGGLIAAGFVAPVLLGAGLAGILWLIVQAARGRRPMTRDIDQHVDHHSQRLRADDRRFAIAAGLLVVGSGLSVLYVPNHTFGGFGDYLALFLWGAAFGEGVQLARRFVPTLI